MQRSGLSSCLLGLALSYASAEAASAQCDPHEWQADEAFWQSDVMSDESVVMIAPASGGLPEAPLLWPATEIVSVRDSSLAVELERDVDWTYEDGVLRLTEGSHAASVREADLRSSGQPRFEENHWYHTVQLAVTYRHEPGLWRGPLPGAGLERLRAKLVPGAQITLAILGDSISVGYSASGHGTTDFEPAAPYLMPWPTVVSCRLQQRYGVSVALNNASVAGTTSAWGRSVANDAVAVTQPDVVAIAFGMNDAAYEVSPGSFGANIQAMIDVLRAARADTEIVLIAPMLANPGWSCAGDQRLYLPVLREIAARNAAVLVDMTTTHEALLARKRYVDMTGNGLNHPNDFLSRWYGYLVSAAINGD